MKTRGLPVEERVKDLVSQMTLEEKAGAMYITMIGITPDAKTGGQAFHSQKPHGLHGHCNASTKFGNADRQKDEQLQYNSLAGS